MQELKVVCPIGWDKNPVTDFPSCVRYGAETVRFALLEPDGEGSNTVHPVGAVSNEAVARIAPP